MPLKLIFLCNCRGVQEEMMRMRMRMGATFFMVVKIKQNCHRDTEDAENHRLNKCIVPSAYLKVKVNSLKPNQFN